MRGSRRRSPPDPDRRERHATSSATAAGPTAAQPPNNWSSAFGGPAWTRVSEPTAPGPVVPAPVRPRAARPRLDQPPRCARSSTQILRFWLDRGVDGFRIDVAHGLAKEAGLPDVDDGVRLPVRVSRLGATTRTGTSTRSTTSTAGGGAVLDAYTGDRVFVGRGLGAAAPSRLARYVRPDELHTAFNFDFLLRALGPAEPARRRSPRPSPRIEPVGAPATWVLSNHDEIRHVTRLRGATPRARHR